MDVRWSELARKSLSYCIDRNAFERSSPGRYAQVVSEMDAAAAVWEQVTNVRFTHVASRDQACITNSGVTFNVAYTSGQNFWMKAFVPNWQRSDQVLYINEEGGFNPPAPFTVRGTLIHELGHILGFAHEDLRSSYSGCEGADDFRTLTAYDSRSIMNRDCTGAQNTTLSQLDIAGVRRVYSETGAYFADVTGDLRADALVLTASGVYNRRSTGINFGANEQWTTNAYHGDMGTYFADVTGDGKADAVVVNATGVTVRRSSGTPFGTAFGANESWLPNEYGTHGNYVADWTGDGKADFITVLATGFQVYPSTGTSFSQPTGSMFGLSANLGVYFADVTGDKRWDAIGVRDSGIVFRESAGDSAGPETVLSSVPYYGQRGTFFADVTADGRADAIVVNDNAVTVRVMSAGGLGANSTWLNQAFYGTRGTYFADVDGDARADIIAVNDGGIVTRRAISGVFGSAQTYSSVGYYGIH